MGFTESAIKSTEDAKNFDRFFKLARICSASAPKSLSRSAESPWDMTVQSQRKLEWIAGTSCQCASLRRPVRRARSVGHEPKSPLPAKPESATNSRLEAGARLAGAEPAAGRAAQAAPSQSPSHSLSHGAAAGPGPVPFLTRNSGPECRHAGAQIESTSEPRPAKLDAAVRR